jgi:hypothetical protein
MPELGVGADEYRLDHPQAVAQARKAPQVFPFGLKVSAHELRRAPRLVVHRQGVDEDVVMLRRSSGSAEPSSDRGQLRMF